MVKSKEPSADPSSAEWTHFYSTNTPNILLQHPSAQSVMFQCQGTHGQEKCYHLSRLPTLTWSFKITSPLSICYVTTPLTNLQLWVHFIQTPVNIAVTVGFLKEIVQNISCHLALIHHQGLGAVIVHVHLDNKLRTKAQSRQLISEATKGLVWIC